MKKFRRLLILLVLTVLTIFALLYLAGIDDISAELERVNWGWMAFVVVIFYSTIIVRGTRWHRILKTMGWSPSLIYTSSLMIAGLFVSAILPARLGDVGRVAFLRQDHKVPIAQGVASIATERALDVCSILVLTILGSYWALQGRIPADYLQLIWITSGLLLIGLLALFTIPTIEKWLRHPLFWSAENSDGLASSGVFGRVWAIYHKILDFGFSMINAVRALGKHPATLMIVFLESLYIWLGDALLLHFSLVSIASAIPLGVSIFSMMVADLISAVPITPGAIGQFEVAVAAILAGLGINRGDAALAAVLLRLVSMWTLIPMSALVTYLFGFARMIELNQTDLGKEMIDSPPVSSATAVEG